MDSIQKNLWGIILAGGAGKRLLEFTKQLYGYPRPKQYCVITGARSMLEHTFNRARMLISPDRLLTVINQSHKKFVDELPHDQPAESFVIQPECRDTGPGLLLPLLKIHHADPNSTVVTFPADHFILENQQFMEHVKHAVDFVNAHPETIILIGVRPHRPEVEYGWIEPGTELIPYRGRTFYPVRKFWEKPSLEIVEMIHAAGCYWNTFVLIGKASTFMKHIQQHMKDVTVHFRPIQEAFGTSQEDEAIKWAYMNLPTRNFSQSVLERISEHLCVLEASNVYWNDWGNERRIRLDVEKFNLNLSNGARVKNGSSRRVPHRIRSYEGSID